MQLFDMFWSGARASRHFRFATLAIASFALAGCGSGGYSGSVTDPGTFPPSADNSAVVTRSASGAVSAMSGQTRTLDLTFNASDQSSLTNLVIATNLTQLPEGWTAPANFSCATVSSGSRCVLTLTYAPTTASSGNFSIDFSYLNAAGASKSGQETISYVATPDNNSIAAAAPSGQVNAIVGAGRQPVLVSFTTDDGSPASSLQLVTRLDALPAGWTSTLNELTCAVVSTGNGCSLPLNFTPTTKTGGTLTLEYTYQSNTGVTKNGAANISYSATANNNIVSTLSPSGQVAAAVGTGTNVLVSFASDDGNPLSDVTVDLAPLPAGWSARRDSYSCGVVSSGHSCNVPLTFSPTTTGGGTFNLNYSYRDDSGTAKTGSIAIDYRGTSYNNVIGTILPGFPVEGVVGATRTVTISFVTDDGLPARQLEVTGGLSALPAGWSSAVSSFTCATVDGGSTCSFDLSYTPTAVGSGSIALTYDYLNNSGLRGSNLTIIPYRASTHNAIVAQVNPASVALELGETGVVAVTLTTNDGNAATNVAVDLNSLPSGWSGASTFGCATVTTGNGCSLNLTYAPSAAAAATTLSLPFTYVDNAGSAANGVINIPYSATARTLYVANYSLSTDYILMCDIRADGSLAPCRQTHAGYYDISQEITNITDMDYRRGKLVLTQTHRSTNSTPVVWNPQLTSDGGINRMYGAGSPVTDPRTITLDPTATYAYVANAASDMAVCRLSGVGFTSCGSLNTPHPYQKIVVSSDGSAAYGAYANAGGNWTIDVCLIGSDGTFTSCSQVATGNTFKLLDILDGRLYGLNSLGGIDVCPIVALDTLGACTRTALSEINIADIAFTSRNAYMTTFDASLRKCAINLDGTLGMCVTLNDPGFVVTSGVALR